MIFYPLKKPVAVQECLEKYHVDLSYTLCFFAFPLNQPPFHRTTTYLCVIFPLSLSFDINQMNEANWTKDRKKVYKKASLRFFSSLNLSLLSLNRKLPSSCNSLLAKVPNCVEFETANTVVQTALSKHYNLDFPQFQRQNSILGQIVF